MKTHKLWCEAGEHHWERPAQRGRKPRNCPEHLPAVTTSSTSSTKKSLSNQEKGARLAEGRRRAKEQREREAQQAAKKELAQLKKQRPGAYARYERALNKAVKVTDSDGINRAFDKADALMSAAQGISRRIQVLEEQTR